jgi:hypothetical protein
MTAFEVKSNEFEEEWICEWVEVIRRKQWNGSPTDDDVF